jgi:hypothetical protein
MGVGLVQGYCLSKAVSDINRHWERALCNSAAEQVGWRRETPVITPMAVH